MVNTTEQIKSARQANLMITDIETNIDVQRWTLAMMKAIRAGVDFMQTETFNEIDALVNEMEKHCAKRGTNTTVYTIK
jgi:23S rRNA maturation mini-RNase III